MRGNVIPFQQRMFEMIGPSLSPAPAKGTLGQANTRQPTYLDVNGKPITSIPCGGSFTFDVPGSGLNQIWLTIYKDGTKTYDALYSIPMPGYVTSCESDVGTYQVAAYDPQSGISLGQTSMIITPAGGGVPSPSPIGNITSWFSNLSSGMKLALAAAGIFLLMKTRKL